MVTRVALALPQERIADFCVRWKIRELALFGSVLREDFTPLSDVDVLVTFEPAVKVGLVALSQMERELGEILGRTIDLIPRDAVEQSPNLRRRQRILESAYVVYAA
ncbi:MAG: nucleotidyltransferase domain-containing protein [Chloroflexi bacterium]|nr:nucleotidyltransferase domain-containing protein [Chloroflexota bacterium]